MSLRLMQLSPSGLIIPVGPTIPTAIESSAASPFVVLDNVVSGVTLTQFSLDQGTGTGTWSMNVPTSFSSRLQLASHSDDAAIPVGERHLRTKTGISSSDIGNINCSVRYVGEGADLTFNFTVKVQAHPTSASIWAGDNSGLAWSSGGFSGYNQLTSLRTNANGVRGIDAPRGFHFNGTWSDNTPAKMIDRWKNNDGGPWNVLKTGGAKFMSIAWRATSCGGGSPPATWPTKGNILPSMYISSTQPVGWTAAETNLDNMLSLVRTMWTKMGDGTGGGHFDHLWRAQMQGIRDAAVSEGFYANKYFVLNPFWENNKGWVWGSNHGIFAQSYSWVKTTEDCGIVKSAFRQFCNVARSITWPDSKQHFLVCFGPHRDGMMGYTKTKDGNGGVVDTANFKLQDVIEFGLWDAMGPDYYDTGSEIGPGWPTGTAAQRWNEQMAKTGDGLQGLTSWLNFIRAHPGERLCTPEWGCWEQSNPPNHNNKPGDDNPYYIGRMYDLFSTNSDIMAFEQYFNTSVCLLQPQSGGSHFPNASYADTADSYKAKWATK